MLVVDQASLLDGLALDAFSVEQDGLATAEVVVSRGQVTQALVAALVVGLQHDPAAWEARATAAGALCCAVPGTRTAAAG